MTTDQKTPGQTYSMKPGIYRRRYPDGCIWFCRFDGAVWFRAAHSVDSAHLQDDASNHQELPIVH